MERKLILFEANEVPYRVLDRYCREKPRSTIAKLMGASRQFESRTDDKLVLDPWVSWATLHRGVNDEVHGILHLGQSLEQADQEFPPVWKRIKQAGLSVGVFGSLHSSNVPSDASEYAFYVPDYFSASAFAHPSSLLAFQQLNLAMTRASARNVDRSIPGTVFNFLRGARRLGVSLGTLLDCAGQLAQEIRHGALKIRRRTFQAQIMSDLFLRQMENSKPHFGTFYTNHVAAAMHRYWGASFPEDYETRLDEKWIGTYSKEITFAMDKLDAMLCRLVEFVDLNPEYSLIVASSLGQAAIPAEETHEFLTITDLKKFMVQLGVPHGAWTERPAMVPCQSIVVESDYRSSVESALEGLVIDGRPVVRSKRPVAPYSFDEAEPGAFQLFIQFDNYDGERVAILNGLTVSFEALGLGVMQHEDGVNCTAQHIPEGALFVYHPNARLRTQSARALVSTVDVVPSILAYFGLEVPSYMRGRATILSAA